MKEWLFHLSYVVIGGLIVATVIGLLAKQQYDETVSSNRLLSFFNK
jgi:hypothetical protein